VENLAKTKVATATYNTAVTGINNKVSALQTSTAADHTALTTLSKPLTVQAQSAGSCDGNFFRVFLNGQLAGGNVKVCMCNIMLH